MGTNLRLSDELAVALREAAGRTGRSQQDIVRAAIAKELGLASDISSAQRAVQAGLVDAPTPFRDVEPQLTLPQGTSTANLLDRDDR